MFTSFCIAIAASGFVQGLSLKLLNKLNANKAIINVFITLGLLLSWLKASPIYQ
jgi:hypothetical protein